MAGEGRYFISRDSKVRVQATIQNSVDSVLCTVLRNDGAEIPLLDGSSKGWTDLIKSTGLCVARDDKGLQMEKLVPKLLETVHLHRDDSFIVTFPSSETRITYGIDFPVVQSCGMLGSSKEDLQKMLLCVGE